MRIVIILFQRGKSMRSGVNLTTKESYLLKAQLRDRLASLFIT